MSWCLCTHVELVVCCGLFCAPQLVVHWGSLSPSWSLLRVCLGRWVGSCLWHCTLRHHGRGAVGIVLYQLEDVSGDGNPLTCTGCLALHTPGVALMVLLGHKWDVGRAASLWLFPFLLSHRFSALRTSVCAGFALWALRSRLNSPCWAQRCCCRSISSIYLELLSALQLLLTQINVSFLSLYFLQSWHVAGLHSVGAELSLELRSTFSPRFPGNSRPPPHCICYNNWDSSVPQP